MKVPAACWKVIVAVPEAGGDDLAKIGRDTRVITVWMPNDNDAVGEEWKGFRTSPGEVERLTGLHFFDRLPADVAQALREKVDGAAGDGPTHPGRGRGESGASRGSGRRK